MRSHPLVVALALALPLSAQTSVETGGGVARLDNYSGGVFSSFRGQVHQNYGALQISFMNTTVEHRGLGTGYRTEIGLGTAFYLGAWQVNVGPQLNLARGIATASARTLAADIGITRDFDRERIHLKGGYQQGLAWSGNQRNRWRNGEVSITAPSRGLQVGASLRFLSMNQRVPRTDVSFDLRDPGLDTMYRETTRHFEDVGVSVGWEMGRVSLAAQYGGRFSSGTSVQPWWVGDIAVKIASSLALTFNSSQQTVDPVLRLHGGRYASFGLRLGGATKRPDDRPGIPTDPMAVEVTRSAAKMVSLKFAIPGVRNSAVISGEFSGWQPIPLTRLEDGRWEAKIVAGPGLYRMNIRADDGAWAVPPGLRSVADDFGGVVGLLVISS